MNAAMDDDRRDKISSESFSRLWLFLVDNTFYGVPTKASTKIKITGKLVSTKISMDIFHFLA